MAAEDVAETAIPTEPSVALAPLDMTLKRSPANIVLLVDVSGSMNPPDRLPLAKQVFTLLVDQLQPTDWISIVRYAGNTGVMLPPTRAASRPQIVAAIGRLPGGEPVAGTLGLPGAYELARVHFDPLANNRILLATDSDYNVGVDPTMDLPTLVAGQAASGIVLSVLRFGRDSSQDAFMQSIVQRGRGAASIIGNMADARRALTEQLGLGTDR